MNVVFAYTFYFLALVNPRDRAHAHAVSYSETSTLQIVTTAWILTEVADGLASRNRSVFIRLLRGLRNDAGSRIIEPTRGLFDAGVAFYDARPDKQWSLTDCISFVVMDEHGLAEALTGDHHFEQAGYRALLK